MKYKHIPAALHNFGHSFLSLINLVDDECVRDVLIEHINRTYPVPVVIPFQAGLPSGLPSAVVKSVLHYREWLPKHFAEEGLRPEAVEDVTLVVELSARGLDGFVTARDNRGKNYRVRVAA